VVDSSKPDSAPDASIEKRPAETLAFSEQVILFHGRYGRRKFWLLSLALPALLFFIVPPLAAMNNPTGGGGAAALFVMSLPFVWLYCKLLAHRLHDIGWSGWWSLLFILLPILMVRETTAVYDRIEQSGDAQQAIQGYVIFMLCGSFAIFLGGFIPIGCLPGTQGPNKFGPDPLGAPNPPA
jgi:uncharacterized membrane protein YhaH (DUF805 family)